MRKIIAKKFGISANAYYLCTRVKSVSYTHLTLPTICSV